MPNNNPAKQYVQKFAQSYPNMLNAYIACYDVFIQSGYDISKADESVSGINREPSASLSSAVKAVNDRVLGLKAIN
jgi:hypothetical protein